MHIFIKALRRVPYGFRRNYEKESFNSFSSLSRNRACLYGLQREESGKSKTRILDDVE